MRYLKTGNAAQRRGSPGWRIAVLAVAVGLQIAAARADLLAEARAALDDELYELAQKKGERYLKENSGTADEKFEGVILLAQALRGQHKYPEMLDLLIRNQDQSGGRAQADAFDFWLALALAEVGKWPEALGAINGFQPKHPASPYRPHIIRLKAKVCLNMGQPADALAAFAAFADKFAAAPEAPANLLDWGRTLVDLGRYAEARQVLERLQALHLENRIGQEGRISLGSIYLAEKSWDQARMTFVSLLEQKNVPDQYRALALFSLAEIAEAQSNLVEALNLLGQGIAQTPDKGAGNLRKGKLLLKMGKIDEGTALVREFVSLQSTNELARDVQLELAQTLLAKGLNDKALGEYQNFLETFTQPRGLAQAYQGKGWALFNLARYNEAALAFEKAAELAATPADKARLQFKVGDCHFASRQFKLAGEAYERVMLLCSETPLADQALFQKAECLVRLGELARAEECLWELMDRGPADALAAQALLRIAEIRQKAERWPEALAIYAQVANLPDEPARAAALNGIGSIHFRLGRYDEALDCFERNLRMFPGGETAAAASFMSAWCHYMLGRDDAAGRLFADCARLYPRSSFAGDAIFWIAERDYNHSRFDLAEAGFGRVADEYPQSALADQALFWAGRAALRQKEFHRANDRFSRLIKQYPASSRRPEARFYQGEALCELGEFAGAILIYDEIIKQFSESPLAEAAWFRKGDSQFALGSADSKRYEEAIGSYRLVLEHPSVSPASRLQAEYKTGRALEKLGKPVEAFDHYMKVVYGYFNCRDGDPQNAVWFTRAAFNAAALMEGEKNWRKAVNIYQRVLDADVPAAADAKERIKKIRADQWLFFY